MTRTRPLGRSPRKVPAPPAGYLPPKDAEYVQDWTRLQPGQKVILFDGVTREVCGQVDAVTEDGGILWLHMEAGGGRRLFSRLEDGHFGAWRRLCSQPAGVYRICCQSDARP